MQWYGQRYMGISSYLFSVLWGGGAGHGIHLVGVLLLCLGAQAERLYAMTPAGSLGRSGDGGQ